MMAQQITYRNFYKARKEHYCDRCHKPILPGTTYVSEFLMPEWKRYKYHVKCWERMNSKCTLIKILDEAIQRFRKGE